MSGAGLEPGIGIGRTLENQGANSAIVVSSGLPITLSRTLFPLSRPEALSSAVPWGWTKMSTPSDLGGNALERSRRASEIAAVIDYRDLTADRLMIPNSALLYIAVAR